MRRRSTWPPAPAPTPGQVLPALVIAAVALAGVAVLLVRVWWLS